MALTVGCGYSGVGSNTRSEWSLPPDKPAEPGVISLEPKYWYIQYSTIGPHPSFDPEGAWSFFFPQWTSDGAQGHVNYVQTAFEAVKTPSVVTITYKVESTRPKYRVFGDKLPATFRLFFEQKNDDLRSANGRWWSNIVDDLGSSNDNQVQVYRVFLTPKNWTNVDGKNGTTEPSAFKSSLANVGYFGLTFGGQWFAGHGVALTGGTAKFILIDYTVD